MYIKEIDYYISKRKNVKGCSDETYYSFDGECNFCDSSVQFILNDANKRFMFASLQGETGRALLQKHHIPEDTDSFLLIENGKVYMQSSAALQITKQLNGLWKFLWIHRYPSAN